MALICCSNEKHGLFLLFFFNFALRLSMCAGELESMCQHVVCFSFRGSMSVFKRETNTHANTNSYTQKENPMCMSRIHTGERGFIFLCVCICLMVVSVAQTSWMVTHTLPFKQNTLNRNEDEKKLNGSTPL